MKIENTLLVLWIIFGFIFVSAIDAVLYLLVTVFYSTMIEIGVSYGVLTFLVPITTLIIYISVTIILINRIRIKSKHSGIYLTEFPKKLTIALGVIAIILPMIINKLASLNAERAAERASADTSGYLYFYGWLHMGFGVSQLTAVLILFIYFIKKIQKININ